MEIDFVLSGRRISGAETGEANQYYQDIEESKRLKREKADVYKEKLSDLLQPVLRPGTTVEPVKWLKILLVLIGVQFAWTLFGSHTPAESRCFFDGIIS